MTTYSNPKARETNREVLPSNVRPKHYFLSYTKIDLETDFKFEAKVEIDLQIISSQKITNIILNSVDIEYKAITIQLNKNQNNQQTIQPIDIKSLLYDVQREEMNIPLTQPLSIDDRNVKLIIIFTGDINNNMKGFYRSKCENSNGEASFCGVTQLCAIDARRAFPCFDEPNIKASFTLQITCAKQLVCISNMPIMTSIEEDITKCVTFEKTPIMSTYLLVWVIGELECVESQTTRGIPVRVWTTFGHKSKAEFALKVGCRCLDWYEKYFEINYPLPKLDMMAVPDFAFGAMENWGLITYRQIALLCDEKKASLSTKQHICIVVCHELAHQWFGNLVTMEWWSQLWLNEGFACFMQYLSSDALYPQWRMWDLFLTREYSRAYELDGLTNSHAIQVDIASAKEANEIFDAISYCKGASVIRMLQSYIGDDAFRRGLNKYLNHFAYKNAVTTDLWTFLAQESGKPVGDIMQAWTSKQGFPLIHVSRDEHTFTLTQSRYLSSGKPTEEQNQTVWNVPLCIRMEGKENIQSVILDCRSKSFPIPISCKWLHINADSGGFYCCQYEQSLLDSLNNALGKERDSKTITLSDSLLNSTLLDTKEMNEIKETEDMQQLTIMDRVSLIRDTKALAASGIGNGATIQLLNLIRSLKYEKSYPVWVQILDAAFDINHLLSINNENENKIRVNFHAIMRDVLQPIFNDLQWDEGLNEDETRNGLFRPLILKAMNKYGDKEVIQETLKRFTIFMNQENEHILVPSLRKMAYTCAIVYGDVKEYQLLKKYYLRIANSDAMESLWSLRSLGSTENEKLIVETLEWTLNSDEVRKQDKIYPFQVIASTQKGKIIAWQYLQKHWNEWFHALDGGVLVQRLAKLPSSFITTEMANEVEIFYMSSALEKFRKICQRSMNQCIEQIRQSADWRDRKIINIAQWTEEIVRRLQ